MNPNVNLKTIIGIVILITMNATAQLNEIKAKDIEVINLIPIVLGDSHDPISDGVKKLSFKAFGELYGKNAHDFWVGFQNKVLIEDFASKGKDFDLLVLMKNKKYERIRLRIIKDSLFHIVYNDEGSSVYKLSEDSYEILKKNWFLFVNKSDGE